MITTISVLGILVGLVWLAHPAWRVLRMRREAASPFRVPRAAAVDTWECRKAVHEAGHAACAWCCTLVSEVRVASIESKGGGGHVLFEYRGYPGPEGAWCQAVISFAGVVAESMVYGKWDTRGSKADLEAAFASVLDANGFEPPWERLGETGGDVPQLERMFARKPPKMTLQNLEECWRMARVIVEAHGGKFFKLVSVLLAHRTAKTLHMEEVLGKRYFEKLVAIGEEFERLVTDSGKAPIFKPRFVLPRQPRKKAA